MIRLGTLDDLVPLANIEISAASLYPKGKIPEPHESLPYDVMRKAVQNKLLFCAEKNNSLVGFAACHLYENFLHLDEISVLPSFGKQGIGSSLVKHLLTISQKHKCLGTTLTTFSDLAWNAPFYKKLGFNELSFSDCPTQVQAMLEEERDIGLSNRIAMFKEN